MVIKFNRNYVCSINADCLILLCCFTCLSTCTQRRASGRLWWTLMEVKAASCDQTGASLSDVAHLLNTRVFCPPVLLVIDSIHVMSDRGFRSDRSSKKRRNEELIFKILCNWINECIYIYVYWFIYVLRKCVIMK